MPPPPQPPPANSPETILSLAGRCATVGAFRLLHGALLRRLDLLPAHTAVAVLAKLLRFAAVSPAGDLRQADEFLSLHLPFLSSSPSTSHLAFFYNTLMRGYAASSSPAASFPLFAAMRRAGANPDAFTFTFLLKSRARCSPCFLASDVHAQAIKHGCLGAHGSNADVHNALLHAYASLATVAQARRVFDEMPHRDVVSFSGLLTAHLKAKDLDAAREVFDAMPERDVVSWTAMITGYARARRPREALALFDAMPVPPDEVTMVSVVSACTALGDLATAEHVRRYIDANGFGWMVSLCNALIDMYAKCGCLAEARAVFDGMPARSLVSWNTLISAYASHGDADNAIALFHQMLAHSDAPWLDGVTLLTVLSACAHQGRVEAGRMVFEAAQRGEYGSVELTIEHYGCIVDMLGRAGHVDEACQVIDEMPIPSNEVVWGALLSGCRIHGDVDTAERAVRKLMELRPEEGGYYILLSDMYASAGRTAEAAEIRRAMNERGARKTIGRSSWTAAAAAS